MEVLIFLIVIVVLIVVHELGHFLVAKWSGMRVDEFGLGYPPRAATIAKVGETEYTLNWLPFGGFVKIYGEDLNDQQQMNPRAFGARPRILQALTLIAGIAMNFLFAFILLVVALALGTPRALSSDEVAHAKNIQLAVGGILPNSPAASAGLMPVDYIVSAKDNVGQWSPSTGLGTGATTAATPADFSTFINISKGAPVTLEIERNNKPLEITATPAQGIMPSDPSRYALGVEVATVGIVPLSAGQSVVQGAQLTWGATRETAIGLVHFFGGILTFHADLSQVAGPVGIAGAVGSAASTGLGDLLSLAALISINLALINLIPVPALDGGRLLFVTIESVTRRPIKPAIANTINSVGFALLVLLMVVVTLHDIYKIVI